MGHVPVLSDEVVDLLAPALAGGGVLVDATVGYGGHAAALLARAPRAELVGIDRDPEALEASRAHLSAHQGRVRLVRGDFQDLEAILERLGHPEVRGVLFDLGVSSPQLDEAHRGFGYRAAGPLDMRMDPSRPVSAHEVVNAYPAERLAGVIKRYGEERFAERVAHAIVAARPIETTDRLAEVVRDAIPAATRRTGGHPARRTFQAIRIEVNDELEALRRALPVAVDELAPGGRIGVISYHSLEDRIVKRRFASEAKDCVCPPDFPVCRCDARARLRVLTRRPLRPSSAEGEANPRSASARLRAAEKLEAPAE